MVIWYEKLSLDDASLSSFRTNIIHFMCCLGFAAGEQDMLSIILIWGGRKCRGVVAFGLGNLNNPQACVTIYGLDILL